jgi:AraC-like DNA-binding protein
MKDIVYKVNTISDLHKIAGFEPPKHPLVSIIDYSKVRVANAPETGSFMCAFYCISFKKYCNFVYGMQPFDHQEGTLHCTAPEQIITFDRKKEANSAEGWGLYFHPELIRNSTLGKKMQEYAFFAYQENESLHLSEQEKQTLLSLLKQMEQEYNTNIDHYSHDLIISNIELLLNYCKRFYGRQFITRTNQNKDIIANFEKFLNDYVLADKLKILGIPTVKYCAEAMNLSANYFGDLLKNETGRNAQEHVHAVVLEQAKTLLVGSDKRINEIAYDLGFEYPQNFSKLFKQKTGKSPTDFRNEILLKSNNFN